MQAAFGQAIPRSPQTLDSVLVSAGREGFFGAVTHLLSPLAPDGI